MVSEGVRSEITELAKSQGVVVWMPEERLDDAEFELLFPGLKVIFADRGFLNLNLELVSRGGQPTVIIARKLSDENSLLHTSLTARFVTFTTSLESQLRKQLGWPSSLDPWLAQHGAIFEQLHVVEKLKKLVVTDLDSDLLSEKAVYAASGADARMNFPISMRLLGGEAEKINFLLKSLAKAKLEQNLWKIVGKEIGYTAENPTFLDFKYWLANSLAELGPIKSDEVITSSNFQANLLFFFEDFRLRHENAYVKFCEDHVNVISSKLRSVDLSVEKLATIQNNPQVDGQVLELLLAQVSADPDSVTSKEVSQLIQQRLKSPWFRPLRPLFESLKHGLEVLELVGSVDFFATDFDTGIDRYVSSWFRVDFSYRKHVYFGKKRQDLNSDFAHFSELVERTYVNGFQDKLGNHWSSLLETLSSWPARERSDSLRNFYKSNVLVPLSNDKNKIAVIISDALRFEIGFELNDLLREDGYSSELRHLIAPLPSYTQLGMASLLPNSSIVLKPEEKTVLVDDRPSAGLANRLKILESVGGSAIDYETLVTESNLKQRLSSNRLWYVYHNKIDKVGDNAASEGSVFEAVDDALDELRDVIKRLNAAGFKKIFVTADHGFLYQESEIPAHGFLSTVPEGEVTEFVNRRFIIGRGLKEAPGLRTFTSAQLGYDCDHQVQIPASTLRLRRQGSGLRFVHGGATLQEIVVPVLSVTKAGSGLSQVEVSIAAGSITKITTGVLALKLSQDSPVAGEMGPRKLRAYVAQGDDILSSTEEVIFDSTDPEPRNRVFAINLIMANRANSLESRLVQVRLESNLPNTERWARYAEFDFEIVNLAERDF